MYTPLARYESTSGEQVEVTTHIISTKSGGGPFSRDSDHKTRSDYRTHLVVMASDTVLKVYDRSKSDDKDRKRIGVYAWETLDQVTRDEITRIVRHAKKRKMPAENIANILTYVYQEIGEETSDVALELVK